MWIQKLAIGFVMLLACLIVATYEVARGTVKLFVFRVFPAIVDGLDWLLAFMFVGLPDKVMELLGYRGKGAVSALSRQARRRWPKYYSN